MDKKIVRSICKDVADFNGLVFSEDETGISISNGFFDDDTDEDEVNYTLKLLRKAKAEIEGSGVTCSKINRKDDWMRFDVEYNLN